MNHETYAIVRALHARVSALEGLYEDEPGHERDRCQLFQEGSDPVERYGMRGMSVCKRVYDYLKQLYEQNVDVAKELGKKWYVEKGREFVGAYPHDDYIRLDIESSSGKMVGSRIIRFGIVIMYFPYHKGATAILRW